MENEAAHKIQIHYCPRCKWLMRAAWYAQELLSTFHSDLAGVELTPSRDGGVFQISLNGVVIMDRRAEGFLTARAVKQKIRDAIDPGRGLGHID